MNVAHFYHCYAGGDWEIPVQEHCWALKEGEFDGPIFLGLVGPPKECWKVKRTFEHLFGEVNGARRSKGWEQGTLSAARLHATAQPDGAVLYAHTKGAANPARHQTLWRQTMQTVLVEYWREAVEALEEQDVDAVGCHWLPPAQTGLANWAFGGNYWLASCRYLRTLPAPGTSSRHDAETWVGQASPKVLDVLPGRPPSTVPIRTVGRLVVPL